jgi:hypothetical protein
MEEAGQRRIKAALYRRSGTVGLLIGKPDLIRMNASFNNTHKEKRV